MVAFIRNWKVDGHDMQVVGHGTECKFIHSYTSTHTDHGQHGWVVTVTTFRLKTAPSPVTYQLHIRSDVGPSRGPSGTQTCNPALHTATSRSFFFSMPCPSHWLRRSFWKSSSLTALHIPRATLEWDSGNGVEMAQA